MWERFWRSYGNPCLHCALYITGMPWKVWRKPPRNGQLPHGKTHLHTHAHRHTVCCSHRWEVEVQPRSSDILTSFRHVQLLHTHNTSTVKSLNDFESLFLSIHYKLCNVCSPCLYYIEHQFYERCFFSTALSHHLNASSVTPFFLLSLHSPF